MTDFFKEKIEMKTKRDVIRFHILIKSYEKGYNLSFADIDTLYELYDTGYSDKFLNTCVEKQYFKSLQTVRNSVSKMTKLGIIRIEKKGTRTISKEIIPQSNNDQVIFNYMIGNR